MKLTVDEIAGLVGGTVHGDGSTVITGVNGLEEAAPGDLVFVRESRYLPLLEQSKASAVLIGAVPEGCAIPAIVVGMPDLAFAQVLQHCDAEQTHHPVGVHESAHVHPGAQLGANVAVAAGAVVEDEARLGDGVVLYSGAYVGRGAQLGAGTIVYPNAVIRERCQLGERCVIHAGAVIGSDGFGFAPLGGRWAKIPQVGIVVLGDDVEVGSCTCIDRATFGETVVGAGTKIDNLVMVGHNVRIGEHCVIAGTVGIAGSARIGNHVRVGASAGIKGHLEIGDNATVAARAGVVTSVEPGRTVSGFPAIDHAEHRRVMVGQRRVPELLRRVKQLERKIAELEEKHDG
ncbi:MAG: UDP-3-O-(3-hydroxymyristoyl)glucosamine N-acyltransferase [Candidatus Hydrogenedens sp.]|nr:UDP-3-O-(3-hydroxymyristoyl)glucosamine N-acyltransferase [Candidatus Hydrogenedens sp.]